MEHLLYESAPAPRQWPAPEEVRLRPTARGSAGHRCGIRIRRESATWANRA